MRQKLPLVRLTFVLAVSAMAVRAVMLSAADDRAPRPTLRQPGFIFLELETPKVDDYAAFIAHVAGFHDVSKKPGYIEMESTCGQLLLIDPAMIPNGHPFHGKVTGDANGIGVEIGIVVADLDKAYAAAKSQPGWRMSTGIVKRPWGVRDFRVLSPDGYYLRFTEGN